MFSRKRRKDLPELVAEEPKDGDGPKKKIETLKAGKLARLALDLTQSWLDAFGPRPAGSDACRGCADAVKEAFGEFCTTSETEDVSFTGSVFPLIRSILPFVYVVVLVLLWIGMPVLATVLYGVFSLCVVLQVFLYLPVWRRGRRLAGRNVTSVIEPEGEVLHTVVFSAHHDSAPILPIAKDDRKEYFRKVLLPFGCCTLLALECLVQVLTELVGGTLVAIGPPPVSLVMYLVLLTLGIPFVARVRGIRSTAASPGAGDNLASDALLVQVARYFDWKRRCGRPLAHTRVVFASFDGEECGLKGSSLWFASHSEYLEGDCFVVNCDSLYHADSLCFLDRDVNGTVPLDASLAADLTEIARTMGYAARVASMPVLSGGSDAASAARAGVRATTMTAIGSSAKHPDVTHTEEDVVAAIEPEMVEEAIGLAIKIVEKTEEGLLAGAEEVPEPGRKGPRFKRPF